MAIILVIPFLIGAGGLYESVGAALDRRIYDAPGRLVELAAGQHLHLNCTGTGSPTIVLEALSGGVSPVWGWVQPQLARETRVCSYDRPGRGWSDPIGHAQDAKQVASQLNLMLQAADVEGPYVLVGHSLGGLYARMFASQNPDEVAGMVLLDSAHPEQFERMPEEERKYESFRRLQRTFSAMARIGFWRAYFDAGGTFDFGGLPDEERGQMKAIWSSPELFKSQRYENDAVRAIHRQVRPLGTLGDIPLLVISAGKQPREWLELQEDMVGLSTNSTQRVIDDATHVSLIFDKETAAEVADGILEVLQAARNSSQLGQLERPG